MNKTGKKNIIFSKSLYNFENDVLRKSSSVIDQYGNIILNNNISINLVNDSIIFAPSTTSTTQPQLSTIIGRLAISSGNEVRNYLGTFNLRSDVETIQNILTSSVNKTIENIYFDFDKHYEQNNEIPRKKIDNIDNKLKLKIDFNYNFYNQNYENFLNSNPSSLEQNLPDYYLMVEEYFSNKYNIDIKNFNPIHIYNDPEQNIKLNVDRSFLTLNILDSFIYLNNGYLSLEKYINSININKNKIPFYTNIYFDCHQKLSNNFNTFFHEHGLFKNLLSYINNNLKTEKIVLNDEINNKIERSVKSLTLNDSFINSMLQITEPATLFSLFTLIDSKRTGLVKNISGQKNYSEVVGYRISKYDSMGNSASPIEEWLLPNVSEYGYELIDSQIKYNKNYKYKVSAFVMVVCSDYKYSKIEKINDVEVSVTYEEMPKVKIFELDSCEYINKLLDRPPLEPEVEFFPYVLTDDKIKIILKHKSEVIKAIPIPFTKKEYDDFFELIKAHNIYDQKLSFGNDEIPKTYFIYRTDKKPEKYSDFYNQLLTTIPVENKNICFFEDTINFSKTYYYMFRSVDNHDHLSNPSEVYEINLSEGKLTFKTIEIEKNNKSSFKSFRRYIKISPSTGQRILSSMNEETVDLGVHSESLWNKKFKIRLVSKNSSKKLDINLIFDYQIDK